MKNTVPSLALALALATAGLYGPGLPAAHAAEPTNASNPDKVLATVNGTPITERMYDLYARQRAERHPGADAKADRQKILDELINLEVVIQDAESKNIEKRPEVKAQLAWQRGNLLASVDLREHLMGQSITKQELQSAYDEALKHFPTTEYHARHILTKTRKEAEEVIAQLNKGADFAKLAKEKSIGPTGKKGGDLGWFSPDQMVKPFAAAVATLKKGQYTKQPVKTRFGWHVIELEGTRKVTPPSLDDVKDQLEGQIRNHQVQQYVDKLRKSAKVDIKH
ncbi:MAG: peptidylprolyl isomerase [Gammaproteobacteria bacterium]